MAQAYATRAVAVVLQQALASVLLPALAAVLMARACP